RKVGSEGVEASVAVVEVADLFTGVRTTPARHSSSVLAGVTGSAATRRRVAGGISIDRGADGGDRRAPEETVKHATRSMEAAERPCSTRNGGEAGWLPRAARRRPR